MERNLAVLIDFENIAAGTEKDGLGRFDVEAVLSRLSDKGRILIARSYADWGRFARFKQTLLANNVSMMELTSHGMQDKNRADIALVVEGVELAFTKPYIDTFVIVSGDSDFTPMVLKMRELDKRVIGVGCRSSTSRLLVQACDEFIFYDNLAKRRPASSRSKPAHKGKMGIETAIELLVNALEGLQRENPTPPLAGIVKSAMLRKSPDFSEGDLGFSSFARFLERAQKSKKVIVSRDDKSGGYRVDSASSGGNGPDMDSGSGSRDGDDAIWLDPYLPEGTSRYVEALSKEGLNPLAASTRKSVLQAIEESVAERNKRKRRVTAQFVQEDVRRKTKKTDPDLPARAIRQIFNGLMRTGTLLHRDGSPVRTTSAPFTLEKTAEELNEALADIYIDELHQARAELDVELLADLFFGNRSQTRRIEEAVAYLQAHVDDDGGDAGDDLDEVDDLDALLLADGGDDEPAPKKKATKAKAEAKADGDEAGEVDEKKAAPKKRTRKKKPTKAEAAAAADAAAEAEPAAEPAADEGETAEAQAAKADAKLKAAAETPAAEATDEDAPKKPRRRRTRKKAPDTESGDDMDGLLSAD